MLLGSGQTLLPRGVDEDHRLADFVPARFDQQRGVDDDGGDDAVGKLADFGFDLGSDKGVEKLFEVFAVRFGFASFAEDELGDGGPRDPPCPVENFLAPAGN